MSVSDEIEQTLQHLATPTITGVPNDVAAGPHKGLTFGAAMAKLRRV